MKKLKLLLSFVFVLGIVCLGFSFVSNSTSHYKAFAYSSQIVLEESTFNMAGGVISNSAGDNGGAVYVGDGATFTMSGGTIKDCSGINGGAVYVGNGATFTMTGGKIKNSTATNGGAVYIANGGTFMFEGGKIESCSADLGYAVYVASGGTFNYEYNGSGITGCGEGLNLHIYAEDGATIIGPGTKINVYVDDWTNPAMTMKKQGDSYTIDEAEMPLDYESCCGYFYDEKLSQCTNGVVDLTRAVDEYTGVNIYTKTASPEGTFSFTHSSTLGLYLIKASSTSISGDLVFPKEYEGVQTGVLSSTTTTSGAFYGCTGVTSITFQEGLQTIPAYMNYGQTSMNKGLSIPDSVTEIGTYAFYGCNGLTGSLVIPNSVTTIGVNAFQVCSGFSGDLIIPNSVTTMGTNAFYGCSGITGKLTISTGLTSISERAFTNCGFTGELKIPESIRSVGQEAFSGCTGFTGDLILHDNMGTVDYNAFYGCTGFNGCLIATGISAIRNSAFQRCGFTSVYLAVNTTLSAVMGATGYLAPFYGCSNISAIYLNVQTRPSNWGDYWNSKDGTFAHSVKFGYTLEEYKAEVGYTAFAPNIKVGENTEDGLIKLVNVKESQVDLEYYNQDFILDKKEYVALLKKNRGKEAV
ncbi:MAG: leucine-rich repeat domain-containing protein [Clostridia bacterium]|nr:leucine-rich repeat domain-containing protein [Clostridia bacterium]